VRTGEIEQGLLGKISFALPQAASVILGILLVAGNLRKTTCLVLLLVAGAPLLALTFASSIRSPVFLFFLLLAAGCGAGATLTGKERTLLKPSRLIGLSCVLLALLAMMAFLQSIRLGDFALSDLGATLEHMRIWFAGYIPAFRGWLLQVWDGRLTYGAKSFRFLAGLISGSGSYVDTVDSDIYIGDWRSGNAATALRTLINDFGFLGCGLFILMWGGASAYVTQKAREGSLVWTALLAVDLACVLWSPNNWFLLYGSRFMAGGLAAGYLMFGLASRAARVGPGPRAGPLAAGAA
jgi:oligosaccharide repeat unit polymerase